MKASINEVANTTVKKPRKKEKKSPKPLNIAIRFEDTLTDSNYTIIDLINKDRERSLHIDYDDFDESNYISIWEYPEVNLEELANKNKYITDSFNSMDLAILSKEFLQELIKLNYVITIFSEYDSEHKESIKKMLAKYRVNIPLENIICNVTEDNVIETLHDNNIELYIEDNPYIIRVCDKELPLIIVRSQTYNNETCFNMIRLECYSQSTTILKRANTRIEKILKKREKK